MMFYNKLHFALVTALAVYANTLAMNTANSIVHYYENTPINIKNIADPKFGPQPTSEVILETVPSWAENKKQQLTSALTLTFPIRKQSIKNDQDWLEKTFKDVEFFDLYETNYRPAYANPANRLVELWHREQIVKKTVGNFWDPKNRTDENYEKIEQHHTTQTLSMRACYLALLQAWKIHSKNYVVLLPTYLQHVPGTPEQASDNNYFAYFQVPEKNLKKLQDNPDLIKNIPEEAINEFFNYILDAAAALWDNENYPIYIKTNEQDVFQKFVIGLREKPNNQWPEIFYAQDKGFYENCQYEGLKTFASLLRRYNNGNNKAYKAFIELIKHNTDLKNCSRWKVIEKDIITLALELKKQRKEQEETKK